jgi:hypothetical protein
MIVLGIVALVLCIPLLLGGIALAVIFGTDGSYETNQEHITTSTRALVSAVTEISKGSPAGRDLAGIRLQLHLTSASDQPLFIGIGRAGDVSKYLDGVNVDRIDDFQFAPFRYRKTELPGDSVPPPPDEQTFWVASTQGTGQQQLNWRLRTGTYQVVVMNADSSAGVDVTGTLGVKIPWIFWVALGLLIVGLILLAGGILLIVFGAKRRPPKPQPVGYTPYPGQPIGYAPYPGQPGAPPYGQPVAPGAPPPGGPWTPPPAPPGSPAPVSPAPPGPRPGDPLPPPPSPPG